MEWTHSEEVGYQLGREEVLEVRQSALTTEAKIKRQEHRIGIEPKSLPKRPSPD